MTNCTVPLGVPEPDCGVTIAVNDTDWPKVDGLSDELTDVFACAGLTTCPPLKVPVLVAKALLSL